MHNQIKILNSLKLVLLSFILFFGNAAFAATKYKEVNVNTITQLEEAVAAVTTPTKIIVANGTYNDSDISLRGNKAEVHIIAQTKGQAVIQRTIKVYGDNITIEGFKFNGGNERSNTGGSIYVSGNDCHITRCNWDNSQARQWLRVDKDAYRTEISYNIFQNKNNNTASTGETSRQTVQLLFTKRDPIAHNHYIHHNHWKNIVKGRYSNRYESLQIVTQEDGEEGAVNGADQNTIVEYNLFEDCNGEGEIISNKCNASIIRYNTFKDSNGGLTLRWGNGSQVYGNSLFNCRAGVVSSGKYHKIHNNYIENMSQEGILIREGAPGMDGYGASEGVDVSFNTAINCRNGALRIGKASSRQYGGELIKSTTISNNILIGETAVQISSPNNSSTVIRDITFSNNMYKGRLDSALKNGFSKYTGDISNPMDTTHTALMTEKTTGPEAENTTSSLEEPTTEEPTTEEPETGAFIIKPGILR